MPELTPAQLDRLLSWIDEQAQEAERAPACLARQLLAEEDLEALPPAQALARRIDHTLLKPDASVAQILQLCQEARQYAFASVCVNPAYVRLCAEMLRGARTLVCCVAGFPLGAATPAAKAFEAEEAVIDGACEVDMVINVGALKSGDYELVARDILGVTGVCGRYGAGVTVIIEAALLSDAEKVMACRIAQAAGAAFVKTSTGFGPGGATTADVALMRATVGPALGVKAAGGIRTLADARAMLAAGANRLGASAGVRILQEAG